MTAGVNFGSCKFWSSMVELVGFCFVFLLMNFFFFFAERFVVETSLSKLAPCLVRLGEPPFMRMLLFLLLNGLCV